MVNTVKFSQFVNANLNTTTNLLVGVSASTGGVNIKSPLVNTWTTAGRPTAPYFGLIGANSTTSQYEFWNGSAWITL